MSDDGEARCDTCGTPAQECALGDGPCCDRCPRMGTPGPRLSRTHPWTSLSKRMWVQVYLIHDEWFAFQVPTYEWDQMGPAERELYVQHLIEGRSRVMREQ